MATGWFSHRAVWKYKDQLDWESFVTLFEPDNGHDYRNLGTTTVPHVFLAGGCSWCKSRIWSESLSVCGKLDNFDNVVDKDSCQFTGS